MQNYIPQDLTPTLSKGEGEEQKRKNKERTERQEEIIANIIEREITIRSCKSSGPGGQNVNKRETQAIIQFDIENSSSLTEKQKEKLRKIAKNKINHQGILRLTNQEERDKERNIKNALQNFKRLLILAFEEDKERKMTQVPKSENEKRIANKKKKSKAKAERKKIQPGDV